MVALGQPLALGQKLVQMAASATAGQDRQLRSGGANTPALTGGSGAARGFQRSHGSACLARQGQWDIQLHAVMHHFGRDPAALTALKLNQTIAFHRAQRAR